MGIAGIVAEFNPLHNGHEHLIQTAKKDHNTVVCVISGNFVQRGDTAIIPKFERAKSALEAGADMVLELPVPWSMSTAANFALGAVSQLSALNIDTLYFGSECGDSRLLEEISEILISNEFNQKVRDRLSTSKTFADIRQTVLREMISDKANVLSSPNDTLATEYIIAAKKLGLFLNFVAVKRLGVGHDKKYIQDGFTSSTYIRTKILENDIDFLKEYMPKSSYEIVKKSPISDINRLDLAIISRLKLIEKDDFSSLPDISEGIDNLIYSKVRDEFSYNSLLNAIKSKRYTLARIRRIILSAFLGIDNSFFLKEPPYARILGFSKEGAKIIPKNTKKPLISRVSDVNVLDEYSKKVFSLENKANEVYALSLDNPNKYINDFSSKIIKK